MTKKELEQKVLDLEIEIAFMKGRLAATELRYIPYMYPSYYPQVYWTYPMTFTTTGGSSSSGNAFGGNTTFTLS